MNKLIVLFLVLAILLAPAAIVTASPEVPYKSGDYIVYKFTVKYESGNQACSVEATIRVEITKVEYPYVSYTGEIIDTKANCPSDIQGMLSSMQPISLSATVRVDTKPAIISARTLQIFVDPSYSGEESFEYSMGGARVSAKVRYKSGVLVEASMKGESTTPPLSMKMEMKLQLVETSIQALKGGLKGGAALGSWVVYVIVALVVMVTGAILAIKLRSRKPVTPTTTPPSGA